MCRLAALRVSLCGVPAQGSLLSPPGRSTACWVCQTGSRAEIWRCRLVKILIGGEEEGGQGKARLANSDAYRDPGGGVMGIIPVNF